jgi:hypothetical protein
MNEEQRIEWMAALRKQFMAGMISRNEYLDLLDNIDGYEPEMKKEWVIDPITGKPRLKKDAEFLKKKNAERADIMADERVLYYAGIGSRSTPEYILQLMEHLGSRLREDRMVLRSGHAPGADQAFERGAGGASQIFLPWASFEQDVEFSASRSLDADGRIKLDKNGNEMVVYPKIFNEPTELAMEAAADFHPAWGNLSQGAKKLHARNAHQILGPDLSRPTPVEFVICWTKDGGPSGGTGQAIRMAESLDIPVYNLFNEEDYDMAFEWVWDT